MVFSEKDKSLLNKSFLKDLLKVYFKKKESEPQMIKRLQK